MLEDKYIICLKETDNKRNVSRVEYFCRFEYNAYGIDVSTDLKDAKMFDSYKEAMDYYLNHKDSFDNLKGKSIRYFEDYTFDGMFIMKLSFSIVEIIY